jgi:predicted NBD/HSP70 family sugar kinase
MRRNTYQQVISALREGVHSKRAIQDHTGLSWGSCSPVINHLLAQGMIIAGDMGSDHTGSKGRKTRYFNFSSKHFLLMGMDIEQSAINCCVATLGNEPLGYHREIFDQPVDGLNLRASILQAYQHCCEHLEIESNRIDSISLSLPGAIDEAQKIWLYSPRIEGIDTYDFSDLESIKGFPDKLYIQHDIHAQANSIIPNTDLNGRDYVFVHVGEGIGMSANMGGIIYGSRGFAGEIGHIPYPYITKEISCSCGNKNCLETVLNSTRILKFVNQQADMSVDTIRDMDDQQILQDTVHQWILPPLVYMATIVSNIFDPQQIIIGGSVLEPFYNYIITPFEEQLREQAWLKGPSEICWYRTEDMDGAYGAILHSGNRIVEGIIDRIDLDHYQ